MGISLYVYYRSQTLASTAPAKFPRAIYKFGIGIIQFPGFSSTVV